MYIKIWDYIFIFGDDTCVEQEAIGHTGELSGDEQASEQLTLAEIPKLT